VAEDSDQVLVLQRLQPQVLAHSLERNSWTALALVILGNAKAARTLMTAAVLLQSATNIREARVFPTMPDRALLPSDWEALPLPLPMTETADIKSWRRRPLFITRADDAEAPNLMMTTMIGRVTVAEVMSTVIHDTPTRAQAMPVQRVLGRRMDAEIGGSLRESKMPRIQIVWDPRLGMRSGSRK